MAQGDGLKEKVADGLRQVGPARLAFTLLFLFLGVAIARYSWSLPFSSDIERGLYDARADQAAERVLEQDPRITLVTYNDDTLAMLGKRSPLDRAMLARALSEVDAMKPRSIGVDILIDQAQPEDDQLIQALKSLRTPTYLAFASARHNPDQILPWQEDFLRSFLRSVGSPLVRPASIRLEPDLADGVTRRWPGQPADLPPLLANAMASEHPEFARFEGAIDFRLPATSEQDEIPIFANLPIHFLTEFPEGVRPMIEGRHVLIGGDIQDLDEYDTPSTRFTGRTVKGVALHAQLLAQKLDGRMPPALPGASLWLLALLAVLAGALTALVEFRGWRLALLLLAQILLFGAFPFLLHEIGLDTLSLPAFGWAAGWMLAFAGVGTAARAVGSEQRRFAQSALGKYLPGDVARQIMRNPSRLALHGEKKQIHTLFTDLEDFTRLSHAITPEQLSSLLNAYLDRMSEVVLRHGGTIDKFVGDAVVAFWGAPIARPDDADRAILAAIDLYEAGQAFAASVSRDLPPIGRTRVGLHRGEAVVGNFGGEGRIQYTALGDAMNTAARLESANKSLKSRMLVSREAMDGSSLDLFRPLGRIVLSGRETPVEVWEPVPDMDPAFRAELTRLWLAFDGGDRSAHSALERIAAEHPEDAALSLFVYRLHEAGPGGHFVLASK